MKKQLIIVALIIVACKASAQTGANSIIIRHDTATLKPENCEWIIKSLAKNNPALNREVGKSLSQFLLDAIEKGKLKAFDGNSNEAIPAKKIYTWHLMADSMMTQDEAGNPKIIAVQRKHSPDKIDQVRIYQDWYLDVASGKLRSVIKCIELREAIYSSLGEFLGHAALCRVYY